MRRCHSRPSCANHRLRGVDERGRALQAGRQGTLRLLSAAPERFASDAFLDLLRQMPIARFVVDEAHCVSAWAPAGKR